MSSSVTPNASGSTARVKRGMSTGVVSKNSTTSTPAIGKKLVSIIKRTTIPEAQPEQPQTFLDKISNLELLNAGAFSKVYKGNIKGIAGPIAIKAVSPMSLTGFVTASVRVKIKR